MITVSACDGSGVKASLVVKDDMLPKLLLPKGLSMIAKEAYAGDTSVSYIDFTEVTAPADISIGAKAFAGCTGLVKIVVPEGITIAPDAFEGCAELVMYGMGEESARLAREFGVGYVAIISNDSSN